MGHLSGFFSSGDIRVNSMRRFSMHSHHFSPECLTVNLGRDCNLNCVYCFSKKNKLSREETTIHPHRFILAIEAAAHLVAKFCKDKKRDFYFGVQGDGEPLVQFDLLKEVVDRIDEVCKQKQLKKQSFITSNGTMEQWQYTWLAGNFSRVCISVDGPAKIHNRHRPMRDGEPTYSKVVEALTTLRQSGIFPVCRVTVTTHNVKNLKEIVGHLHHELGFTEIQIEPAYHCEDLRPTVNAFSQNLMLAKKEARRLGCNLVYSGLRNRMPHGPYCNALKNVLFIKPNGTASACMFSSIFDNSDRFQVGQYDDRNDEFVLEQSKFNKFITSVSKPIDECTECPIRDHCVRGCPDFCTALSKGYDKGVISKVGDTFRCQTNRLLLEGGWCDESSF